jgi:hypothetical protein
LELELIRLKQTLEEKFKHCEDQIAINNIAILYVTDLHSKKLLQNSIKYYKRKLKALKRQVTSS